jgi:glycosyltransferase involved in cell wall biosynthesis
MRIAIDARLNAYRQGGIPQYTRQLVTALADVAAEDQIVSFQHRDQLRPLAIAPNVVRRTALTPPHHRFEQWTLPLEVLLARPDVLHCPDFIAPTRRFCPAVVTIHDLAFMHYPEILDASARTYYSQVTSNAPRADAIIAVSESTRQDIAQFLDIPIEQIDVIYEAAAPLYTQLELREGEARVLNSTPVAAGTFMLFVSTLEPRKNLPTLLQALRICIDRRPEAGYRLVIVGRRGWRDEAIFQTARDLKLADHVLFTGNVGQYDLRWLYNACRLYINPSLYEGFGLPLLEAMACGAACLAAATSSLPEIGGDAAIYVPPLEAEQWADEIMALWDDEDRRAELGRMGVARAQQFSWNRAARETLKVYRRAVEGIVPRAEPLPALRYVQQPDSPLPPSSLAALGLGSSRPCLRCGTALLPGELQIGMSVRSADSVHAGPPVVPRVWSCPRCGYVELVDETHRAAAPEHASASLEQRAPALVVPSEQADTPDAIPTSDEEEPIAESIVLEDAPLEEPTALDDEQIVYGGVPAEAVPLDELPDAPPLQEDELATSVAPADIAPIVYEDGAVEKQIERDEVAASVATLDTVPLDAPSDLSPAQEDLLTTSVAPADTVPQDARTAREDVPADEAASLEARAVADADVANAANDASSAPATVHTAHAPNTANGLVPKPKSGRRSRRQPAPAEPSAKQPPKRRSSGSKRKQTT